MGRNSGGGGRAGAGVRYTEYGYVESRVGSTTFRGMPLRPGFTVGAPVSAYTGIEVGDILRVYNDRIAINMSRVDGVGPVNVRLQTGTRVPKTWLPGGFLMRGDTVREITE